MTRNTQNTISTIWIFLASFVFTFMVGWIVYEMIEKSPDIDYTKSYSVEEVQKLVDEKVTNVTCGVINNEILCIYTNHKTSLNPVFCTVKWNGK
jgi:hypothetical protein